MKTKRTAFVSTLGLLFMACDNTQTNPPATTPPEQVKSVEIGPGNPPIEDRKKVNPDEKKETEKKEEKNTKDLITNPPPGKKKD